MSSQKSNQPGAPAHKHITFTPASETSQGADDSASSAYNEPTSSDASQKEASAGGNQNQSGQQSWLDQQQWLKNIDVQQIKDLGTKAMDQVNKMSPTQKVIGGALLAGGLSWLALRSKSSSAKGETYRAYRGSSSDSKNSSKSSSSSKWDSSNESVYRGATRSYGEDDYASDL
ncbi:hypothetical protein HNQ93_003169 [Hymenobacter luteus]|uniref:Uncharacterized protein n=2 Tax=Hymenobacter TaxID=89966 RepID=A0A7W9T3Z2_9BACT|nr:MULTISPECIES: hypothetical protein [Hymenobacter]MBB4602412.1 hypothetical protein [Hymenobacter latericoloratus]MBB6060303.1 hypothetical protein [Hymenobacter luteus]